MILIGAPSIVSGSDDDRADPAYGSLAHVACLVILRHSPRENAAQLGRDGRQLSEFVVVRGVCPFEVREVDDRRAQRGELGDIGVVADPRHAAGDGS